MFNGNEIRENRGNFSYLAAWEIQPGISKDSFHRKVDTSHGIRGGASS
jgi:hypothetical protein